MNNLDNLAFNSAEEVFFERFYGFMGYFINYVIRFQWHQFFSILNYHTKTNSLIFYLNQEIMIEEEKLPAKSLNEDYDYNTNPQIQPSPNIWNKFLFFNRFHMLYNYIVGGIKRQTLLRYNDNFKPMLSTTTILEKYFRRKEENKQFNITAELFKMEKGPFIFLLIMSVISGCTSLVPIYFQSVLVKAVIGTSGDYYSIYVVAASMLARFFLLNYTLNLSSNISMNVKLHLQNTFMRSIFYLQEDQYPALKGRIKYLDVDLISEALYYIPYFITSVILILGALAFTFIYVSPYSLIVIAVYLCLWICIGVTGYFAFNNMKIARRRVTQRQKYARRSIANLMNAAFERMHDYVYQLLVVEKSLQTKRNIKINLLYILGQTFGQMCIVLSAITFFALSHNGSITLANAYYSVLFLTTTFYPMRYIVYGFFTSIKAYEAYRQIRNELQTVSKAIIKDIRFSNIQHDTHVFAQNIGDCYEYKYENQQGEQEADKKDNNINPLKTQSGLELQELEPRRMVSSSSLYQELEGLRIKSQKRKAMKLPRLHDLPTQKGLVVMMVCKVDALIFPEDYYIEILITKPLGTSATKITSKNFMLPDTLKNNICFYSPFDQAKYRKILQITQLQELQSKVSAAGNKGGQEQYLKFSEWHQSRIQLARALYNNVDYLLIDKPLLLQDEELLKNVLAQRRANNKLTLVANNVYWNYFKLADFILTIDRNTFQFGQFVKLQSNPRSMLNAVFMNHHQDTSQIEKIPEVGKKDILNGIAIASRVEDKPIQHLEKATFFELFGFIHRKSEFIVIFALFAAPCFKYYMAYVIGQSLKQDMFWTYFIFGLIYIGLIFFRGLTITLYTNYGSLALYEHICRKNRRLNAHQILELSQRPVVDVEYHQRIIDRNLVMDFEYGQSILIEIMVNFIVLCTGQPLYIAVAIPIIVGIVYSNANYARNAKKMYLLKLKQTKGVHKILALAVDKCQRIARYQKAPEINDLFYKNNKIQTIYDLNIEWLQTGVRTMSEFIVWACFVIFLVIMVLTVKNQTSYTSLVSLGCSMFINLLYLNTFYLKAFRQAEISLYSLTVVFNYLKKPPNPTLRQVRRQQHFYLIKRFPFVKSIQYKDVSLKYFKNVCDKINLTINEGDRVVLNGNANSFKEMVFYMLKNKIFDRDEVSGDILINGENHEQFIIEGLFYLHTDPLLPFFGTIFEALKLSDPELTQVQLQTQLIWFFNILGVQPLFSHDTPVQQLTLGKKQLFQVFKVLKIEKCKVLVIVDGLDHIDMVTRRRLTKYLIKNSDINILIQTTNISQIVHLYPRRLVFNNLKVTQRAMKQYEMEQQRRLVQSKQTMQMLASLENIPRNIKTTKTFADADISKEPLQK